MMNRRQLAFIVILNAAISLVIALVVVWIVEARRPDPEALAAVYTPPAAPQVPIAPTLTPTPLPGAPGNAGQAQSGAQAGAGTPARNATAAPAEAGGTSGDAANNAGGGTVYVIQSGDSLSGVAERFGVSVAAIIEANKLANPDFVFTGQRLVIPAAGAGTNAPVATATPAAAVPSGIKLGSVNGAGNLAGEVVEVANDSDLAVNLQGWRLEKEGGPAYTFGNLLLFPGSGVKVHSGPGSDSSVDVYWNQPAAVWAAGATARLVNAQGVEVARVAVQ